MGNAALDKVENQIQRKVAAVLPGEAVPKRQEMQFVSDKVTEIEEQLRVMGSLSSLSPVDTIRELSSSIGNNIDIDITSMKIGATNISFRGTVPDLSSGERLQNTLEKKKDKFCKVEVLSRGNSSRGRVNYTADITLCN